MAPHWYSIVRTWDRDPEDVVDAPAGFVEEYVITLAAFQDASIGNPEKCSAARQLTHDLWLHHAAVLPSVAILAYPDGQLWRVGINGIAVKQDKAMNVVGDVVRIRSLRGTRRALDWFRTHPDHRPHGKDSGTSKAAARSLSSVMRGARKVEAA